MSNLAEKQGVWFVYDGECPICNTAAHAFRVKQKYGSLHLINAREDLNEPLIQEINRQKLDLDEGMIIYCEDKFYHGKSALRFMAQFGDNKGLLNHVGKALFWSDSLASLVYPWLRGTRNLLLRMRKVGRIDNLGKKNDPIFKNIFGESWNDLPPVIHKHYANRPYTDDLVIVEGRLDVLCAGPIRRLWPLFWVMGGIPPFSEKDVPVTVRFQSDKNSQAFHFNRVFQFRTYKPYSFRSRMIQIKDNDIVEIMRFGIGWRMLYLWDGGKVILKHKGYVFSFLGHLIPLPLTILLGKGYAEEIPVNDDTFDMSVDITHPWWGKVYEYKGRFQVTKEA